MVIGEHGIVCKVGRRIGRGSFGYVHEAKIVQNLYNQQARLDIQIVVKFVDCSEQHNKFDLFQKELQASLDVKYHKLDGLSNMIDSGTVDPKMIQRLYGAQTHFMIL